MRTQVRRILEWLTYALIGGAIFMAKGVDILIQWEANPEPEVIGYRVLQSVGTNEVFHEVGITVTNEFRRTNVLEGIRYEFGVIAVSSNGSQSEMSDTAWITTPVSPQKPGNVRVVLANFLLRYDGQVYVGGMTNYQVFRQELLRNKE